MHALKSITSQESPPAPRLRAAGEVGLIFLVFFIFAGWPAPEVNEPYYLAKAKSYWNAGWCPDDFFLNSADAHGVFYWSFGWVSRWLSLGAMAWCGRVVTWGLLAWAWRRLSVALVPATLWSVLSAALFVGLLSRFHMAGEWVVGGVEAKGFAYVFVLLGLERLVRNDWGGATILFGAATAFHVLVGGWSLVALAIAWLASPQRPSWRAMLGPLGLAAVLALPGLAPAVMLTRGVDPLLVRQANMIYVYERLSHHLVPQMLGTAFIVRHVALILALVALVRIAPADGRFCRLRAFVAAAVAIAAVGMLLGLLVPFDPARAAGLLRYYWFRLSDVMAPLGVALLASAIVERWLRERHRWAGLAVVAAVVAAAAPLAENMWQRQLHPRPPADAGIRNLAAWRELCAWISEETPPEAVFLTPRLAQTFRWHASRAEVVNRKDIPQDAAGIVEWWRRLNVVYGNPSNPAWPWHVSLAEMGSARLRELGEEFGADYVITSAWPELRLERVGPVNSSFAIYRLPQAREASSARNE